MQDSCQILDNCSVYFPLQYTVYNSLLKIMYIYMCAVYSEEPGSMCLEGYSFGITKMYPLWKSDRYSRS